MDPKKCNPDLRKFNEDFTSIGSKIASSKVPHCDDPVNVSDFEETVVLNYSKEKEVAQIINGVKFKKIVGHYGLRNKMLEQCSPVIKKYLSGAFNHSIKKRKNPDYLKLPKVVPIFKRGEKTSPGNYRPISLSCSINKIFRKLCTIDWLTFSWKNFFSIRAIGFSGKNSCVHALSIMTDYIKKNVMKNNIGASVFHWYQESVWHTWSFNAVEKIYSHGYSRYNFRNFLWLFQLRFQYIETDNDKTGNL